jgi:hypothetical protein
MFDLIPVDHDPFNDPRITLIPVDHDPFAVGSAAQPADPAMAAAGTAAPQFVPVDHDPFASAPPARCRESSSIPSRRTHHLPIPPARTASMIGSCPPLMGIPTIGSCRRRS